MTWDTELRKRQAIWPSEHLMRWVSRNYGEAPHRNKIKFLDIGSGKHAPNTDALTKMGYDVTAVDFAPGALCHERADIRASMLFSPETFDAVLDINTLCHVENPPMEKIKDWLKPGGMFFSIAPADDTWRGHLNGKGFVRCATQEEIEKLYECFTGLRFGRACYPDGEHAITSWIITATK